MNLDHALRLPKMKGFEARRGLTLAAHTICAALELPAINVRFCDKTQTASMSGGGELCLANIDDDSIVTRAMFHRWVGFVVHELLHRKWTDFTPIYSIYNPYIKTLLNALEDARIERKAIATNLLGNVTNLLGTLLDGMVTEALASPHANWNSPGSYPFSLAVFTRGFCKRVPVPADFLPIWEEAERRLDTATSTTDTIVIARWVYDQISIPQDQRDQPDQPDDQQGKPCDKPDGKSDDAGDGEGGGEGQGEGTAEGSSEAQEAAQGEGEGQGTGKGVGEAQGGAQGDAKAPRKAVEALPENGKSPAGFNGRVLEVEPTMQGTSTIPEGMFGGTYSEEAGVALRPRLRNSTQHRDVAAVSGKLRFEVRRLFENSGFEEHQHGRRAGSVNVAALHSVATGNTRVFKRRVETAGIDSAVVLMLDVSESMFSDGLITTAVAATVALSEALTAAGVDVCVALFGDRTCVLSPFGQPFKRKEADLRRVLHGGGTNDYFAVRYAHEMLIRHKAERKVLFMLTDGMGAPATRHQVDMGERMGVTTIGLGIHMDVSSVYPNNVTVNSIASLGTVAFNKIKLAA